MIVRMTRVRIAGPPEPLERVLAIIQDLGVLHLTRPPVQPAPAAPRSRSGRERRHVQRLLADADAVVALLKLAGPTSERAPAPPESILRTARQLRGLRRQAEANAQAITRLEDERALLLRYREFHDAFKALLGHELTWPDGRAFYVVLRAGAAGAASELKGSLERAVGREFELLTHALSSGETAVLLLTSAAVAPQVSSLLAESRVQELPAPAGLGQTQLLRAVPALTARLAAIPAELATLRAERATLAAQWADRVSTLRAWLHDRLLMLDARGEVLSGTHLFVLEGWLPDPAFDGLASRLTQEVGAELVVERVGAERWWRQDAPVALKNPALFRPFELFTRMVPLPKYGSIDPTPFVAVFFPMFFGLMLGDVGYGLALAGLAVVLRWKSAAGTKLRAVSAIAGASAGFSIVFGLVFGELFGTLGHHLGLRPLGFDREKATIAFLALTVALGLVHVLLGLVLAVINAWRSGHSRMAMGRGVTLVMIALSAVALLAAFELLPAPFFAPAVVAVLVAFPILIALEGIVAVIELLATFGHILSYARIMALGTASLMLAVVANEMVGAFGSVIVGVLFALLFHLVNFAIGLFSPTLHALRLHYVEFFGKFYSPGGTAYRPLAHWRPSLQGG